MNLLSNIFNALSTDAADPEGRDGQGGGQKAGAKKTGSHLTVRFQLTLAPGVPEGSCSMYDASVQRCKSWLTDALIHAWAPPCTGTSASIAYCHGDAEEFVPMERSKQQAGMLVHEALLPLPLQHKEVLFRFHVEEPGAHGAWRMAA